MNTLQFVPRTNEGFCCTKALNQGMKTAVNNNWVVSLGTVETGLVSPSLSVCVYVSEWVMAWLSNTHKWFLAQFFALCLFCYIRDIQSKQCDICYNM